MKFPPLKNLTKKQRITILFSLAGIFAVICLVVIVMNIRGITVQAPIAEDMPDDVVALQRDPFTGELIADDAPSGSRVACVMVENSADAWPLSGIEDAFLVIEAPVEGGIPRFMACFTEGVDVEKIGPVRSARPYYVSWASGFQNALYGHVGGSPEALEILAGQNILTDLNEFWNGSSFWRDNIRYAPHNAYTSSALLWAAADRLELADAVSPGWKYDDTQYIAGQTSDPITLAWENSSGYDVYWSWGEQEANYIRRQETYEGSLSSDGDVYHAANVVIMETNISVIDDVGRRHIATESTGNAKVCSRGTCQDAVWNKASIDAPLQFYISYPNEPVTFAPGKTWIEVVQDLSTVK